MKKGIGPMNDGWADDVYIGDMEEPNDSSTIGELMRKYRALGSMVKRSYLIRSVVDKESSRFSLRRILSADVCTT